MNTQQYTQARKQLDAYERASNRWRQANKRNGIPIEVCNTFPHADKVNNDLRSSIEVYEFTHDKPKNYFLYIDEAKAIATTWTGENLGSVWFGRAFNSNMGDTRQPVTIYAINGLKYAGMYYKSAGSYARVKVIKK